jgi:hypothetical protein
MVVPVAATAPRAVLVSVVSLTDFIAPTIPNGATSGGGNSAPSPPYHTAPGGKGGTCSRRSTGHVHTAAPPPLSQRTIPHLPLDVAFHTQQLRGFDESRYDYGITQNCSAKINTMIALLYLPASYFSFRIRRLAQIFERMENGKKSCFLTVRMEVEII